MAADVIWTSAALLIVTIVDDNPCVLMGVETKKGRGLGWPGGCRDYTGSRKHRLFLENDPVITAAREFCEETAEIIDQDKLECLIRKKADRLFIQASKMWIFILHTDEIPLDANTKLRNQKQIIQPFSDVMQSLHWIPVNDLLHKSKDLKLTSYVSTIINQQREFRAILSGFMPLPLDNL